MNERRVEETQNHLLGLLSEDTFQAVVPHLERVFMDFREIAYDVQKPIEYAYFPEDGVISIIGVMADGAGVEVATVGNEGMIGLPLFLGSDRVLGQAFSQVAGAALRIKGERFRELSASGELHTIMQHYTQALFTQISQSAACNRLHLTQERFARWLLMTHDRVGRDEFQLTQDFLSQMLGVRRATVSEIAAQVQKRGIVRYRRGRMMILDRQGLEQMTCECYAIIRAEFERLLGQPSGRPASKVRPQIPALSEHGKSTSGDGVPRTDHADASLDQSNHG